MPATSPSRLLLAAAAGAALFAAPAEACTVTTTPVSFGTYNSLSPVPNDSVGNVTLRCHPNVHTPEVQMTAGSSGSFVVRQMRNGTQLLNYNLYTSASRLIVLGDGTGGSSPLVTDDGDVTAGTRTIVAPIYGRVFPLQMVGEGTYSDTLIVTVIF